MVASRLLPHLRRRVRRTVLVLAIALPNALAAAPAAQAVCNPTYPAFGGLSQPADASCPPVPSFTVDHTQVVPGTTVHFDATGSLSSDPGDITEYDWDFGDGTTEVDGAGSPTTQHTYSAKGHYDVTLTVKDAGTPGGVTSSPTAIAVTQSPVAQLVVTPNSIEVGRTATLNATGSSDADGSIMSYEWDYEGDGTYDATTVTASSPHAYPVTGSFAPKVRVTDDDGATDVKAASLNVHNPPVVTFNAAPALTSQGVNVSFDASGSNSSDPGGITEYAWDFNGDGTFVSSGISPTTTHTYSTKGHYPAVLRIKDAANPSGVTATPITITVTMPPVAQLAVTPSPANAGDAITLDAAGSTDPDGSIVRYDWDYEGDGSYDVSTATSSISHVYPNRGNFTPKVRVVDDYNVTSVKTANLVVNNPGAPTGATPPGSSNSGSNDGSGPSAFAATLMGSPIQKVKLVSKSGLTVLCSANRTATCTLRLEVSARDARRLGMRSRQGRPVQIGTARVTVTRGRTAGVRFKLSARVRRALKRLSTLKLSVLGSATDATGQRVALGRVVLVRR
jgi:PKD repeat protein